MDLDCCWTQQEAGSVSLTLRFLPKAANQSMETQGSVTKRRSETSRVLRQNNNQRGNQNVLTRHEHRRKTRGGSGGLLI